MYGTMSGGMSLKNINEEALLCIVPRPEFDEAPRLFFIPSLEFLEVDIGTLGTPEE